MKINKQIIRVWILILFAVLGTYGLSYLSSFVLGDFFSYGIISFFVFVALYFLWEYTYKKLKEIVNIKERKRQIWFSAIIALVFALTLVFGYQLQINALSECGFKGKTLILFHSVLLSISIFPFSNAMFNFFRIYYEKKENNLKCKKEWSLKKIFYVGWGSVFLAWIPVFFAYYPTIMAYDFHRQSQEAMRGFAWFNSHHPLLHTWLIWFFFQIGDKAGSLQTGMAFYSIFQMLVLSFAFAYSLITIYRFCKKKWMVILGTLFYALFPLISVSSIAATKDIIFTALFLIFILLYIERTFFSESKKKIIIDILWVFEGILMTLFRNNAIYAVLVFGIVLIIASSKKEKLRILLLVILLVVGGKLSFEGAQLAIGTEGRGNPIEKYSLIIQQFSRVGYYHQEDMDDETKELINKYVSEEYWQKYNPPLADSVKGMVTADNYSFGWKNHMPEVFEAWISVGLQYPNEYLDAFLCLNKGYWFIDDKSWAEVFGYGEEGRMGAISTYTSSISDVIPDGISHESKLPKVEVIYEKMISSNSFYSWTILSNLMKPALYCWLIFLNFIALIYIKEKKKALVVVFPLLYLSTLFLAPVVQVRYILPIIVVVPTMWALWMDKKKKLVNVEKENEK